jgi:hypothetical protein
MANLYPPIFSLDPDNPEMFKKGKITEKKVFDKIGKIYDESVDIFYGIEFITENLRGIKDFEFTDFIIIHPTLGILFIECKGGLLEYQKIERKWYQNNNKLNRGPFDQLRDGKFNFIELLKKKYGIKKAEKNSWIDKIPFFQGAIFPDTPKIKAALPPDILPEMIIWADGFLDLEKSCQKIFNLNQRDWKLKEPIQIKPNEHEAIRNFIIGDNLKPPFKQILKHGEKEQELQFDRIQQQFISSVFDNRHLIIKGLAGTGKTIIAAKAATKEKYKDKKVLMLTKTKGLCQFLKVLIKRNPLSKTTNLRIASIDRFVSETSRRLKLPNPFPKDENEKRRFKDENEKRRFFDYDNPKNCKKIFDEFPKERFDLVLVDEAQDFHENWFVALNSIVKFAGSICYFYDPLQTTIPYSMSEILKNPNRINFSVSSFNVNYRNTSAISNLLSKLIKKYFPNEQLIYSEHSDTNKGRPPTLIEANSFEEIVTKTIEQVKNLISKEKFKPMDIGVLGVNSMRATDYGANLWMGPELKKLDLKVISAWDYSLPYMDPNEENDITLSDVRSFKGLEKKVIIMVNFSEINEKTVQQIYTGLSRARGDLIIISNQKSVNQIKELL